MTGDWHVCTSFRSFRASKTTLSLKKKGFTINFPSKMIIKQSQNPESIGDSYKQ